MTVRITNEIFYDIADLADNIEENFGSQYRKIVMRPSIVFFVVLEDGVHALRALRQERNWSKILRTETNYTY